MNGLLIAILTICILSMYSGYKKGFLKTAFSLVSWIIVLFLCNYTTPIIANFLLEETQIESVIQQMVDEKTAQALNEMFETSEIGELESALPEELKVALLGEHQSIQDVILNGGFFDTAYLANQIINTISFVIALILIRVLVTIVERAISLVSKLPLIGDFDKLLGFLIGIGKGVLYSWALLTAVTVLALAGINMQLVTLISESQFLTWLQKNNIILNFIVGLQ